MSRRVSNPPQTPLNNEDALERSMRRQRGSTRQRESLADVARRVNESPVPTPDSVSSRRRFSGRFVLGEAGSTSPNVPVSPGDFQEWMKMVRLKRVKANNAFTIQLIDCFHNMVKGASFQEATHTLGGCLTVYKNRIASVKDDTSKLLVGVSEKKNSDSAQAGHGGSDSESENEDGDAEDGARKRSRQRRRVPTGADAFLVPGEKLEIDTNELATTIDPLLRKMSADFDKRGAGALLQYSLKPDKSGRLLLDAEAADGGSRQTGPGRRSQPHALLGKKLTSIAEEDEEMEDAEPQMGETSAEAASAGAAPDGEAEEPRSDMLPARSADLAHYNVSFFANVNLEACEAVPNVNGIVAAVNNPEEGTDALVRSIRAWAMNNPSDTSIYPGQDDDVDNGDDYQVNSSPGDALPNAFEQAPELGLGFDMGDGMEFDDDQGGFDDIPPGNSEAETSIASVRPPPDGNWLDLGFLQRVDAQQSNWAGPSFWKIRRLRARDAVDGADPLAASRQDTSKATTPAARRVAKAPTVIDFLDDSEVDVDELFTPGKGSIYMSARQLDESNNHLLPVDMRVTTSQLVNLALRPNTGVAPAFMREAWSVGDMTGADMSRSIEGQAGDDEGAGGVSTADDGQHDDFFYGGWDDVDAEQPAFGDQRPQSASAMFSQTQPTQQFYGSQRHQLNYARVAKHVDVRKLKDNVWRAINNEAEVTENRSTSLLDVIQETQPHYTDQQRADLSPAMYFISLLHLSNEKGMKLENTDGLTDIRILAHGAA